MIVPIITSITREVFATVPEADKQAALALGATRWEMIKGAVFPHSFGGMVGAVMLGLGRAMGETIAVALVDRRGRPDHAEPVRQRRGAARRSSSGSSASRAVSSRPR